MRAKRTRRAASPLFRRALGGAAVLALGLGIFTGVDSVQPTAAQAAIGDLPTWDDVQRAKSDEAAAGAKVTEIEALIVQVEEEVEATREAAEVAAEKLFEAEDQLFLAEERVATLEHQSQESQVIAEEASEQAAALVSQLYRSGGIDRNIEVFFEADESAADLLLDRLARMEKATERNTAISNEAEQAMNSARSLGDQAESARGERDRLRDEAEANRIAAAEAAEAARVQLEQQEEQKVVLEAQLAALKDTTTETVTGYQERLRLEQEERDRLERERLERERLERERLERERAAQPAPAPGNPSPPASGGGNWVRPLACCYWVSTEWWGYYGHRAIDLAIGNWTPIYAASSGTVTASGWIGTYGNAVFIDHGSGNATRYAHMIQSPSVRYGQWVSAGQVIGYVGSTGNSTGPHLHFETLRNGTQVSPRDFMAQRGIYF